MVMTFIVAKKAESATGDMQDLLEVRSFGDQTLIVVADGAGGMGGGRAAAEFLMRSVLNAKVTRTSLEWAALLEEIDQQMIRDSSPGETTGAVAVLTHRGIVGASVGDSEIWVFTGSGITILTERQRRKPLIGSGEAIAVAFEYSGIASKVLIGTDGLFKYTSRERIEVIVRTGPTDRAAGDLVELVRLKSGALQDDVAIGICCLKGDSSQ